MTKRELEVAKRHRDALVDMRDTAWRAVVHPEATVGRALPRHEALVFALALVDAQIAAHEQAASVPVMVSTAA